MTTQYFSIYMEFSSFKLGKNSEQTQKHGKCLVYPKQNYPTLLYLMPISLYNFYVNHSRSYYDFIHMGLPSS